MTALVALLAGMLFGAGLLLSGMTNPANVLAFLDVTGEWRPSLLYTMAAAIAVAAPAFAVVRRRGTSLRGDVVAAWKSRVDARLLAGSAIFGIGWGLSGICPGPGLVLLATGTVQALAFVGGVLAGTFLERVTDRSA